MIKVGDYVRTYNLGGSIEKIIEILPKEKTDDLIERYTTDISAKYMLRITKEEIIKSSPNIIDLIEVGDYVNGHRVLDIAEAPKRVLYLNDISQKGALLPRENIKSIVTKEQFESMEYKIER